MFTPFNAFQLKAIASQLNGKSSQIPVFEITQQSATSIGGSVQSIPLSGKRVGCSSVLLGDSSHSPLPINAWQFFHAAAKTELSRDFSLSRSQQHGVALYTSLGDLIKWTQNPMRLRRHGVFSRKDATRTYVSGRFGEAISYLFMKSQGYVFWDHLPSLVDRCISKSSANHSERTKKARVVKSRLRQAIQNRKNKGVLANPDFAFEKLNREIALLESKGRMITPGKTPKLKADLSKALTQLSIWQSIVAGHPKAIAAGTYLREVGDNVDDSVFAYVDPPGDEGNDELQVDLLDNNMLRRGNYAAWLRGMGLSDSAESLAIQEIGSESEYYLPVVEILGRKFVFSFTEGVANSSNWKHRFPFVFEEIMASPRWYREAWLMLTSSNCLPVIGLELNVMREVERALSKGGEQAFADMPRIEIEADEQYGISVFPDGSICGDMSAILGSFDLIGVQSFRL